MEANTPSTDTARAQWLLERHPWAATVVHRVVGYNPLTTSASNDGAFYPDDIASILQDVEASARLWEIYAEANPAPWGNASEEEFDAWEEAGPSAPDSVRRYNVLSSGEKGLIHTLALQSGEWIPWSPEALTGIRNCPDDTHEGQCPGLSKDIWDALQHQSRHG